MNKDNYLRFNDQASDSQKNVHQNQRNQGLRLSKQNKENIFQNEIQEKDLNKNKNQFNQKSFMGKIVQILFLQQKKIEFSIKKQIIFIGGLIGVCILLAVIIFVYNQNLWKIEISNYQNEQICQQTGNENQCEIQFQLQEDVEGPIYIYYKLENFYQNHRQYQKSKSNAQLNGQVIDEKTAKSYCGQVVYNKDLGLKKLVSVNGEQLDPDDIAVPCGQIAKSYFNDSFKLYYKEKNQQIQINIVEQGISWEGEKGDKFRNQDLSKQWADIENEHFINWVRTASFSNFEKLWGKIEGSLKKEQGTFKLVVENNYDTDYFGGGKSIVLRNSSFLGGQQYIAVYLLLGLGLGLAGFGGYFLKNYREFQSAEKRINQVQQQFCED